MTELIAWLFANIARAALSPELATDVADASAAAAPVLEQASMREPIVIAHGSDRGALLLQGVAGVLDDHLSKSDRTRLGKKVLNKTRVAMAEGEFPGGGTSVVTVNVPLRAKDPAAAPRFISGVFTLADDGALAAIVVAPKLQNNRFQITAIDDTDNDGNDDLQLLVVGPEGETQRVITWEDGHAK